MTEYVSTLSEHVKYGTVYLAHLKLTTEHIMI